MIIVGVVRVAISMVALSIATEGALAEGDIVRGAQFARERCAQCHEVGPSGTHKLEPPSFASIAVYRSPEQIHDRIVFPSSHSRMETLSHFVTPQNIEDVVAYIVSLGNAAARDEVQFLEPVDLHLGEIEYEVACMGCHGIDLRGDGPDAQHLTTPPTDLTRIAAGNDGVFPAERLAEVIEGRVWSASHGSREMPIWGERYAPDTDGFPMAGTRIDALVAFIEELQVR